jgi:hypothetical protein
MLDPVSLVIANAAFDDEPLSAGAEKALAEAQEWSKHHESIPQDRVLAELGITQEELKDLNRSRKK